jgi:catechol 2,3-dioxygenase-like lactoylglutathione lyase family enzyme
MRVLFVSGVTPISADPAASEALYRGSLGLPLLGETGGYLSTEQIDGVKHFGVWPIEMAAQSCFGQDEWPDGMPVPQVTIEFELESPKAVSEGVEELMAKGYVFLHGARLEPWGQTVARLLSPEGLLVGLSYAPWMHTNQ